jgi:nitroimidazol reductase NimA-like FMN-containing flavoprotein (pyridoxamine 5'-phosphate oxidase superfamily)
MPMTKNEIDALLTKPNVAVLAVTGPNGAPHAVPTWYDYPGRYHCLP